MLKRVSVTTSLRGFVQLRRSSSRWALSLCLDIPEPVCWLTVIFRVLHASVQLPRHYVRTFQSHSCAQLSV